MLELPILIWLVLFKMKKSYYSADVAPNLRGGRLLRSGDLESSSFILVIKVLPPSSRGSRKVICVICVFYVISAICRVDLFGIRGQSLPYRASL